MMISKQSQRILKDAFTQSEPVNVRKNEIRLIANRLREFASLMEIADMALVMELAAWAYHDEHEMTAYIAEISIPW